MKRFRSVAMGVMLLGRLTGISCFSFCRKARHIQFILLPVRTLRMNHMKQPSIYEYIQIMWHRNEIKSKSRYLNGNKPIKVTPDDSKVATDAPTT